MSTIKTRRHPSLGNVAAPSPTSTWEPTHESREDASYAKLTFACPNYIVLENEDGDAWVEYDMAAWRPIVTAGTPTTDLPACPDCGSNDDVYVATPGPYRCNECGLHFGTTDTCRHCSRGIVLNGDVWVDPEATGDDSVWHETCDAHYTFTAEHEPVEVVVNHPALHGFALAARWNDGENLTEDEHLVLAKFVYRTGLHNTSGSWSRYIENIIDVLGETAVLS